MDIVYGKLLIDNDNSYLEKEKIKKKINLLNTVKWLNQTLKKNNKKFTNKKYKKYNMTNRKIKRYINKQYIFDKN